MKNKNIFSVIFFTSLLVFIESKPNTPVKPQITVVMVIDQFANHYIDKLKNNFKYAFKDLLENGIVYTNAYHPHGSPSTATGHTAISTGTLAKTHGISSNKWLDKNNKKVKYEVDESANAKTFGSENTGISPRNILVDGLSDQFLSDNKNNKAFALAFKTRAAVAMGSHKGKALWFDKNTGNFTSSKYYFDELPWWVCKFNQEKNPAKTKDYTWQLLYPRQSARYDFENISDYTFARYDCSLVNKPFKVSLSDEKPFEFYKKTPQANQLLIDLAKESLTKNFDKNTNQFLLWISFSGLDPVGHCYGPNSLEVIDLLYHLDKQIKSFMNFVTQRFGQENVLFVLTSDHGICQIPELLNKSGNTQAKRIISTDLTQKMNLFVQNKFNIENLVAFPSGISFYLDQEKLNSQGKAIKTQILNDLKNLLQKEPGIQNVWLKQEPMGKNLNMDQPENFYKTQIYPPRTGDLIYQPEKYCFVTKKAKGTVHKTCHDYNTHVPLILYQKGNFEKKVINERVWMPQLASTLAKIIGVPKPSACEFEPLPGI